MQNIYILKPSNYEFNMEEHFPKLVDPTKKVGVFLSGGMESSLISLISIERYGKDNVVFLYSDNIFSGNNERFNRHIRTNLDRASKLLNVNPIYIDFDHDHHVNNRVESTKQNIERVKNEHNCEFVLWGFTKLFFDVEVFKQDNMTVEKINEIAYSDPVKYKSVIEEFHLLTGEYSYDLLDIDIPADVYPVLRDSSSFIQSPFKDINKSEVVDLYSQLGLIDYVYGTSSCILESLTDEGKHCGYCFNCQQRYDAFQIHGSIEDKTEYTSNENVRRRDALVKKMNPMLIIPTRTPLNKRVDTIGIWMSGGADSSLLCYLLAKEIKTKNLDIKIIPFTVQKNYGVSEFLHVTEKIKELLDCSDIFKDHVVYEAPVDGWVHEDYQKLYHTKNNENIKNNLFQVLYSGITTNPPRTVQEQFKWGILPDCEDIRAEGKVKEKVRYFTKIEDNIEYEFFEIKPLFDMNKQQVYEQYKEHNLLESLFPLTRSCESEDITTGHCGQCWWCEERQWAFNKL